MGLSLNPVSPALGRRRRQTAAGLVFPSGALSGKVGSVSHQVMGNSKCPFRRERPRFVQTGWERKGEKMEGRGGGAWHLPAAWRCQAAFLPCRPLRTRPRGHPSPAAGLQPHSAQPFCSPFLVQVDKNPSLIGGVPPGGGPSLVLASCWTPFAAVFWGWCGTFRSRPEPGRPGACPPTSVASTGMSYQCGPAEVTGPLRALVSSSVLWGLTAPASQGRCDDRGHYRARGTPGPLRAGAGEMLFSHSVECPPYLRARDAKTCI